MPLETWADKTGAIASGIGGQNTGSSAVHGPERGKITFVSFCGENS